LRGLTSGLLPTLLRDVPYSGLYLMFYSQLKSNAKYFLNQTESKELQIEDQKETKNKKVTSNSTLALVNFGASILAGILASLVTHPFDVIKTKVQVSKPPLKSGYVFLEIVKTEGPRGLFIGLLPRLLRRSLMTALSWTLYESIFEYIAKIRNI
jgi:solute carrier family 25 protein 38